MREVIVALDVPVRAATALVERLGAAATFYKVPPAAAMEDPGFISRLLRRKKRVFLDAKWYDIPSQVKRSVEAAGRLGITACTVHASGGSAMLKAALAARPRPWIWAVTVLTSMDGRDLQNLGIGRAPAAQVKRLARLAVAAGVDGIVCSAAEAPVLRRAGIRLPLITPGIQWGGVSGKDQKRVATPEAAWRGGATHLVVGRSVLEAPDPAGALAGILRVRSAL